MIELSIPGWKRLAVRHLVLDVNGTIATDGGLVAGVAERIDALREQLEILLLTADTHGAGAALAAELRVPWRKLHAGPGGEAAEKEAAVEELGTDGVVACGNGRNDVAMLRTAAPSSC